MTPLEFSRTLDATNLKLDTRDADLRNLCCEAAEHQFAAVVVYPGNVPLCASLLEGTGVNLATVIGFPSGRFSTAAKAAEITEAAKAGVQEVDIVLSYHALREGREKETGSDLVELCSLARKEGLLTKVIVETCYLSREELLRSLVLCEEAFADYIKTSTGFGSGGAEVEDIRFLAAKRHTDIRIKASGGIRTLADAMTMLEAGASRLGTSSAGALIEAFKTGRPGDVGESGY